MAGKIHLKIITPERVVYDDHVDEISALTEDGAVGIFPGHTPLITVLKTSEFRARKAGVEVPLAVVGGIMKVGPFAEKGNGVVSRVVVLADNSEFAYEIDLKKAEKAYRRAQEAMKRKQGFEEVDFTRIRAKIEKELNRIKIGTRHQKK